MIPSPKQFLAEKMPSFTTCENLNNPRTRIAYFYGRFYTTPPMLHQQRSKKAYAAGPDAGRHRFFMIFRFARAQEEGIRSNRFVLTNVTIQTVFLQHLPTTRLPITLLQHFPLCNTPLQHFRTTVLHNNTTATKKEPTQKQKHTTKPTTRENATTPLQKHDHTTA